MGEVPKVVNITEIFKFCTTSHASASKNLCEALVFEIENQETGNTEFIS